MLDSILRFVSIPLRRQRSKATDTTVPSWVGPWARPDEEALVVDPGTGDLLARSSGPVAPSLVVAPRGIDGPQAGRLRQVLALARPGPYPLLVLCPDPHDLTPFEQDPRWSVARVVSSGRRVRRHPARLMLVTRSRAYQTPTVSHAYSTESE